ncbi:MAG: hypothetical protein AB7F78_04635 [Hyphomicrobiaceae bacterium]
MTTTRIPSPDDRIQKQVIILLHGIRDHALWQSELRHELGNHFIVELTNYGRLDLLRFLLPIPLFRNQVVEKISRQVRAICHLHQGAEFSFVAHSFGTFVLAHVLMTEPTLKARRIILCGSVLPYDYPFERFESRFTPPILNEVGTSDAWPAVAESITFGYGSAGTYGFRRPYVRDRWHAGAGHGTFLSADFCKKYWVPFLADGSIVEPETPPNSPLLWVRLIGIIKIKYALLAALVFASLNMGFHDVNRGGPGLTEHFATAPLADKTRTVAPITERPRPKVLTGEGPRRVEHSATASQADEIRSGTPVTERPLIKDQTDKAVVTEATDKPLTQRLNLLVMTEDADTATIPRYNRIFNQVIAALSEELNTRGYDIVDETAASMDFAQRGRLRRSDAELYEVARTITRTPIDAVVVFQIFASARQSTGTPDLRPEIRIPGRVVNVRNGKLMGAFEVSGRDLAPLPFKCDRECVLEEFGQHARVLARDMGAAIADKLAALQPSERPALGSGVSPKEKVADTSALHPRSASCNGKSEAYALTFDGFAPREVTLFEEYFTSFSNFCSVRLTRSGPTSAEYWYETSGDATRLNRNLRLACDQMSLSCQLSFSDNTLRIVKISTR